MKKGIDKMYDYEIIYKNKSDSKTLAVGKIMWLSNLCRLTEIMIKTIPPTIECYVWDDKGVYIGGYWDSKYHGNLATYMNRYAKELWNGLVE